MKKFILTLVLDKWGYATVDGKETYCKMKVEHEMTFFDWDDVVEAMRYLMGCPEGQTATFKIKIEREEK